MEDVIKQIVVGTQDFNLHSFTAEDGSIALNKLMRQMSKLVAEASQDGTEAARDTPDEDSFAEMVINQVTLNLQEADFKQLRRFALRSVSTPELIGDKPFNQVFMLDNGTFSRPEFRTDFGLSDYLMKQCLIANFKPFFTQDGIKAFLTGQAVSKL